mgnify:CR=1 FL=1
MKKLFLLSVLLISVCYLQGRVIFVKGGSAGDGTSWTNAYGDLQRALRAAKAGDQIWVAVGTYHPTTGNDRNAMFAIPNGVQLYGGFAGYESSINARDLANNPVILSGEIGDPTSKEDNSYTVVYTKHVSSRTIVDGFVIQGGYANGTGAKGDIRRCGGGWFNDGSNGASSPTIQNCTFIHNKARDGAALYNYAANGTVNPVISNCRFIENAADLDGGAIFNDGSAGLCSPTITACLFENNLATYGAGIMNQGIDGETRPEILNCQFFGNTSYIRGSSVYNNRQEAGICMPVIQGCIFEENRSSVGRDVSSTINNTTTTARKAKSGVNGQAGY